jgi:hypothetical protein
LKVRRQVEDHRVPPLAFAAGPPLPAGSQRALNPTLASTFGRLPQRSRLRAVLASARWQNYGTLAALGLTLALPCMAELPQQNLELNFRLVADEPVPHEASHADVTMSTRSTAVERTWLHQLQVLNGEWGTFHIGRSMPVQWTRAVAGPVPTPARVGSAAGSQRGSVVNEITWLQAGQALAARVRWPGGNQPAVLDIQVSLDQIDDHKGNDMPATRQSQVATTLTVPLEHWVTLASSQAVGRADVRATLSTQSLQDPARQLLQVLVHVP